MNLLNQVFKGLLYLLILSNPKNVDKLRFHPLASLCAARALSFSAEMTHDGLLSTQLLLAGC